ncbi:MAG: hypothetical protein KGL36_07870 [Gammaproteobacteria bacterium]|nr:hypothetical protein [Gammaproteobacteria bacterium]
MKLIRALTIATVAALMAGCHLLRPRCGGLEDYRSAEVIAPLRVPDGMQTPDSKEALRIPPPAAGAPLASKDRCLEKPPQYRENPK